MNGATLSNKSRVMADQYDISQFVTKMTPQRIRDFAPCETLVSDSHEYTPVLRGGTFMLDGLYRTNTIVGTSLQDIFASLPDSQIILTGYPDTRAVGKPALLMYADAVKYELDCVVSDLVKTHIECTSQKWATEIGVSLHDLTAETNTGNGTSVDNGAATTNGGVAVLHVTAIAGAAPSVVVKIQSSANNSTWSDLLSFSAATAATKGRVEVAAGTTVNRWLREVHTFGGTTTSITFNTAFARR
jgi:hypothetical protein